MDKKNTAGSSTNWLKAVLIILAVAGLYLVAVMPVSLNEHSIPELAIPAGFPLSGEGLVAAMKAVLALLVIIIVHWLYLLYNMHNILKKSAAQSAALQTRDMDVKNALEELEIAERRIEQSNSDLMEKDNIFRVLFDSANDAIFLLKDNQIVNCNRKSAEVFKMSRDEIIGKSPLALSSPRQPGGRSSAEKAQEMVNKARRGDPQHFSWQHIRKDGTVIDTDVNLQRIDIGGEKYLQAIIRDVTAGKKAEAELRASEEKYRDIISAMQEAYFEVDLAGIITFCNDRAYRSVGYTRDEFMGISYRELFDDKDKVFMAFNKVFVTGQNNPGFTVKMTRKDGGVFYGEMSVSLLSDKNDAPTGFRGVVRDITERKEAEDALKESEEKFRYLLDRAKDGIVVIQDEVVKYANQRTYDLSGYSPEELNEKSFLEFIHPDEHQDIADRRRRRMAGEQVENEYETIISHKSGYNIYVELSIGQITYEGRPADMVMARDITENKKAKDAIIESEKKYRDILSTIQEAYYEVNINGKVTFFNERAHQMLDYSADEFKGLDYKDVFANSEQVFSIFNKAMRAGEPNPGFAIQMIKKDGSKMFGEMSVSLIKGDEGKVRGFRGVVRDITAKKMAELALLESQRLFSTLISNLPGMVYRSSYERTRFMEFVSDGCYELTEYFPPELEQNVDFTYEEVIHPADRGFVWEKITKSVDNSQSFQLEYRINTKNGEERFVWEKGRAIKDGGKVEALEGFVVDITEHRRAEEALHISEARLRRLTDNMRDMITQVDLEGVFQYASPSNKWVLGYKPEEMIGKNVFSFIHPDDLAGALQTYQEAVEQQQPSRKELRYRKADGSYLWLESMGSFIYDDKKKVTGVVLSSRDISERKDAEERMNYMAYYDSLTGLPNRMLFNQHLAAAIDGARQENSKLAVLFFDLDNFKILNDTLGHAKGDHLLKLVAGRLIVLMEGDEKLGRTGGDEFIMFTDNIAGVYDTYAYAESIKLIFDKPFMLDGYEWNTTPSIGIAIFPDDGEEPEILFRNADIAMYSAKEKGRNTYQVCTNEIKTRVHDRVDLEINLRKALDNNEFVLYYQPQVSVASGRITGMEALIRWIHPEKGLISPADFIPLAEETGLILPIGDWVLRTVCKQSMQWQRSGYNPIRIAINLSVRQFRQKELAERVMHVLKETGLDTNYLEMEITENIAMHDPEFIINILNTFRKMGLTVSIDDFGTDYSSLNYLRNLPVDKIKIAKPFVQGIANGSKDSSIVSAIVALGRNLGMHVVAEGVETEDQLCFLKEHYCDDAQGFYFYRPMPPEDIEKVLIRKH